MRLILSIPRLKELPFTLIILNTDAFLRLLHCSCLKDSFSCFKLNPFFPESPDIVFTWLLCLLRLSQSLFWAV